MNGETIDVKSLKFNIQKFETALRFFGIEHNHEQMMTMFSAKDFYLSYRDRIIHGLQMNCINEVCENYDEIIGKMTEFLQNVASGNPQE